MPKVIFTANIQRHVHCPEMDVSGSTVREVLEYVFASNRPARRYVLDDQGALRRHMTIFIDGRAIVDRERLSDAVDAASSLYIAQALSGG